MASSLRYPSDCVLVDVCTDRCRCLFQDLGSAELGKPRTRLIASYSLASLVIARMTDSAKPCVLTAVLIGWLSGILG